MRSTKRKSDQREGCRRGVVKSSEVADGEEEKIERLAVVLLVQFVSVREASIVSSQQISRGQTRPWQVQRSKHGPSIAKPRKHHALTLQSGRHHGE